jgi:ABC-2 type transport system ATP-binding protein
MSDAGAALEISGLSKAYPTGFLHRKRRPAVHDLSLSVERGEIFGCLGPNGAGKTTTLKIVLGLVHADAGSVSVLGRTHRDPAWRHRVGYLPEHPYFYDYLTPSEYLDYAGRLFGMGRSARRERARGLLDTLGLSRWADTRLGRFSKGMLQRVGLAQALINDPELVFLDEPMSGLDPVGRRLVREIILDLKRRRKTVFFSTHILPDAETLCDRVGLVRSGRVVKTGRLDEILNLDVSHVEILVGGGDSFGELPYGVKAQQALGERWRLEVEEPHLVSVLQAVEAQGRRILSVQPIRQSLEEYFFKEMGDKEVAPWDPAD